MNLGPYGQVRLQGNPIGPSSADTIVLRKQGIDPFPNSSSGIVDIELVALSLKSAHPIEFSPGVSGHLYVIVNREIERIGRGGNNDGVCDIGEACQPATDRLAPSRESTPLSLGEMEIFHNASSTGGTFEVGTGSLEDYLVSAELYAFNPLSGTYLGYHTVNQNGNGNWSLTPVVGYPSDPAFPSGGFYVLDIAHEGPHPAAPVPVPAAVWLFGSALAGLGMAGKKKSTRVAA